jgi:hypothetical protein
LTGWHRRGGIVARGVLIDYVSYAQREGIIYQATDNHRISLQDIERAANDQGVSFRQGDILIVRSGLVKWLVDNSESGEADAWASDTAKSSVGIAASQEIIEWLWNRHFSAVAGDALAWESVPYPTGQPCKCNHVLGRPKDIDVWQHFTST